MANNSLRWLLSVRMPRGWNSKLSSTQAERSSWVLPCSIKTWLRAHNTSGDMESWVFQGRKELWSWGARSWTERHAGDWRIPLINTKTSQQRTEWNLSSFWLLIQSSRAPVWNKIATSHCGFWVLQMWPVEIKMSQKCEIHAVFQTVGMKYIYI